MKVFFWFSHSREYRKALNSASKILWSFYAYTLALPPCGPPEKVSLPSLGKKETKYKFLKTNWPFKLKSTKLLALCESQYVA